MPEVQRILVATDFGTASAAAVRTAVELADRFAARLDVLHVVEEPFSHVAISHGYLPELDLFRAELRNAAHQQLDLVLTAEEVKRLGAHSGVVMGSPVHEIVRYANEHKSDLIVLGTHGRGTVMHALLGSVAERVVRQAACPVLTIKPSTT